MKLYGELVKSEASSLVNSEDIENNFTIGMDEDVEKKSKAGEKEIEQQVIEKLPEQVITNPFMQVTSFNKLLKMNSMKKQVKKVTTRKLRKIDDEEEQNYMLSEKLSDEEYSEDGENRREYYIKDGDITDRHFSKKKKTL